MTIYDKSNLLVNAYSAELYKGIVGSLVWDGNFPGPIGNSRRGITRNKIFQEDRKLDSVLSAGDKIRSTSTKDITSKEHTTIKSNISAMHIGLRIKKILIVDDEPDIIFTLRSIFEEYSEKFQIATYASPMEALDTFQTNYYDLALIDINMPVLNGFELCEKLVDLDSNLRVCFMSGGEMNQAAIREINPRISIGCFIKKPVGAGELIEIVNSQLE